ncbi:MAG: hypothetical protein ACI90V_004459 [Bacillariaceae sp.]|jgi:hypothetical protein
MELMSLGGNTFVRYGCFKKPRIWRCLEQDESRKQLALEMKAKLELISKNISKDTS